LQERIPNHLKLLRLRGVVVSVQEKLPVKAAGKSWEDERKRTADDVSKGT
jgi:hypothetical protein